MRLTPMLGDLSVVWEDRVADTLQQGGVIPGLHS